MRTYATTHTAYTLDEVRDKAIEANWDINVDHDWWDGVYYDAETIGFKITAFDLDRRSYCDGDIPDAVETARLILENHGASCDTYKLAENFIRERDALIDTAPMTDDGELENEYELDAKLDELDDEFCKALKEEYRCILQNEYDYLTSEEAIAETLEVNEYEYDENGGII